MTAYVRRSYPAKKHDILDKREKALLQLLRTGVGGESLSIAAEKVREAYVNVQKAARYYAGDVGRFEEVDTERMQHAEAIASEWKSLSVEQIVERVKTRAAHPL
jgi:hypothetical protein